LTTVRAADASPTRSVLARGVMHRFIMALIALIALATRASSSDQFTVPVSVLNGYVIVDVRLNGAGPFHFMFDTGAGLVLLDPAVQRLALESTAWGTSSGDGENIVRLRRTRVRDVQIGELHMINVSAGVIPADDVSAVFGTYPLSGFIGSPLLQEMVVKLDYIHRTLTFTRTDRYAYSGAGTLLPFFGQGDISGVLDGVEEPLFVDTGTRPGLTLGKRLWTDGDLAGKFKAAFQGVTDWGFGGAVHTLLARAHTLDIGGIVITAPVVHLSTQRVGNLAGGSARLGYGVLSKFDITFDSARSRIILEKNANFGLRESYDRAGIWMAQQGGAFVAVDVIAGGPGDAAGVKAGDTILAIDGISTSQLVLPQVREEMTRRAVGDRVTLLLQSGVRRRTATLILRDLV